MRAGFIRSTVLSAQGYMDIRVRAEVERKMSVLMSAECDRYSVEWAQCMVFDEETGRYVRAWRCVGKGAGEVVTNAEENSASEGAGGR